MASPVPTLIHADDGEIVAVNDAWLQSTGYTREELGTIEAWTERAYGKGTPRREVARTVIEGLYGAEGVTREGEFAITIASGEARVWDFTSAPIGHDAKKRRLTISMAQDVTARKDNEAALRADRERLAEALEALKESERRHRELVDGLAVAARRKDEFLAVLSHELRNPLGPIRNAARVFRELGPTDPRVVRAREIIDRQVAHMARLLDDLLDVSRLVQSKIVLKRERCELGALVASVTQDYESIFVASGVELVADAPTTELWVDADPTRVAQAIGNVLHNASNYTPRGGRVVVRMTRDARDVVLAVVDNGIGMDEEILAQAFEPFGHTHDASGGGLGLGLTLVRSLIELHGGSVVAESDGPGHGSRFVIRLPAAHAVPSATASPPTTEPPKGRRILLVEDNEDAAETLRMLPELQHHEVEVAVDGPAAIASARRFRPEVVLCDIGLPGEMDGYAVARALRAEHFMDDAKLVAITGYGRDEDQRRAHDAGFDAHVVKPVDFARLSRLLTTSEVMPRATPGRQRDARARRPAPDASRIR